MAKRRLLTLALVLLVSALSQAAPLYLDGFQGLPDIASFNIEIDYDAGTDLFTADGDPQLYTTGTDTYDILSTEDALFDLDAVIDDSGVLQSGTLTITGNVDRSPDYPSGTLLSVNLTDFGFNEPGPSNGGNVAPVFEFVGVATGGVLFSEMKGKGNQVGIILTSFQDNFTGEFDVSYRNYNGVAADGQADTFRMVPEPASLSLLLAGALTLVARRRRRRVRQ